MRLVKKCSDVNLTTIVNPSQEKAPELTGLQRATAVIEQIPCKWRHAIGQKCSDVNLTTIVNPSQEKAPELTGLQRATAVIEQIPCKWRHAIGQKV
ncbi:unnamed protein product [Phytophthora lilii]|uniref:Unnamed protein product n=1 Tax=Phytophthora lilii TaxID=2077276 RepID=A0A9W6U9G7_9STRA|nr:unnamed protein product [Phytophthora lilii]